MMRIDANSWYYSPDHGQICQVIEAQTLWGDPTRKAAVAMTIFGRSGTQLLPMLEGGAAALEAYENHARSLGLVMSSADAEAADAFGDALDDLGKTLKMAVFTIGSALAPSLQSLSEWIRRQ